MAGSISFCLALAAPAAAEAAGEPRAPTSKWNLSYAHSQCIALRDFGAQGDSPQLLLKAPVRGDVMQVAVLNDAAKAEPEQVDATVAIGDRPPLKTSLMTFTPAGSTQRVYLLNMPSAEFAKVRQAQTLSLRSSGLDESFALSQMEPLMKAMDECVANLRREFNVAPEGSEPAGLRSRARANLTKLFSPDDYPAVAYRVGLGGKVKFVLLIQENGRVADCTIVETSGVPVLDTQVCAMLTVRAKFEPARGRDGKPAKDSFTGGVIWRMP